MSSTKPKPSRFYGVISALTFIMIYVPLATLVVFSFRAPTGWTFDWYTKIFSDQQIIEALGMSFFVGTVSTAISIVLGTAAALTLERTRFKGRGAFDILTHIPIIMPETVMGLSLLIWFVFLGVTLGSFSMIVAHVTFTLSYVIITVRTRLQGMDPQMEEAARDLGASPWQTFWKVTFPLVRPGIVSGGLLAFTLSFDDFLVTFFTAGAGSDTLPMKIYSMTKYGVSPEINALSTLMLVLTLVGVLVIGAREKLSSPR